MNSREFSQWIAAVLEVEQSSGVMRHALPAHLPDGIERIQGFRDAGIFSSAEGIVVRMDNGDEFQVTFAQTVYARRQPTEALHR